MKRVASMMLSLVLVFAFVLSGCAVDPVGTTTTGANTTEGTHNRNYGLDLSSVDGWAVVANSALYGAIVDDGYYYQSDDGQLLYLDMNVGTSVILCSKVGCKHKGGECEGYLPDAETRKMMFYRNGGLYYIERDIEGALLVMRRDAAGMAKERVARLGEKLMGADREVTVSDFVVTDSCLYYLAETYTVSQTADGGFFSVRDKSFIARVNLKTGKDETLLSYGDGYLTLVTARDDAVIYAEYDTPEIEIQIDDMGMIEYPEGYYEDLANSPAYLKCWDEASGQSVLLLERTNATMHPPKSYGGKVIFVDEGDGENRYAYDLKTGQIDELDMISGSIINGTYMLHIESGVQTIMNMETGKKYPVELTGGVIRLYNCSDKWLILSLMKPGGYDYYYVPMSAISDGIQAEELTQFPAVG